MHSAGYFASGSRPLTQDSTDLPIWWDMGCQAHQSAAYCRGFLPYPSSRELHICSPDQNPLPYPYIPGRFLWYWVHCQNWFQPAGYSGSYAGWYSRKDRSHRTLPLPLLWWDTFLHLFQKGRIRLRFLFLPQIRQLRFRQCIPPSCIHIICCLRRSLPQPRFFGRNRRQWEDRRQGPERACPVKQLFSFSFLSSISKRVDGTAAAVRQFALTSFQSSL